MPEKSLTSSLATSIVPLGALALAAGCGGGAGSALAPIASQPHVAQPLATADPNAPSVTALLTVTVPARGTFALKRSKPQYISPGSGAIGVRVALPQQTSSPEQVFTLPTPGPAPITTTLPIKAAVGTDTIAVNIYDVSPAATASPNLLSTGSTVATISPTALNTPSVTALGVAGGVILSLANNPSPAPGATARPWTPLENVSAGQSVTINATAVDALGFTISGALATPAPIVATGPVTLSAPSIASGTSTVTATYPQSATAAGTIGSTLPINVATVTDNVTVTPDYGVFAVGTNFGVVDGVDRTLTTLGAATNPGAVAAASCAGGAVAVATASNQLEIVTLAPSTAANPVPAPSFATLALSNIFGGVTFDASCNAYVLAQVGSPATSFNVFRVSGFGSTVAATQIGTAGVAGTVTNGLNLSIAAGTLFIGEFGTTPAPSPPFPPGNTSLSGETYTLPAPGGGSTTTLDSNAAESVAVSGTTVYKAWNGTGVCGYTGPFLQDLQAAQGQLAGSGTNFTSPIQRLVAANDGTLYSGGGATSEGLYSAVPPLTASTWASVANVVAPVAFALTPDPANAYLCDANASQLSFYLRSSLGTAQTPTNVALGFGATAVAAAP